MIPRLTPAASRKLWDILSHAEIEHQLKGTPVSEIARREARKNLGQTQRVLRKIAAMGPAADTWMGEFIRAMNEKEAK